MNDAVDSVRVRSPDDVQRAAKALKDLARRSFDCRVAPCQNVAVNRPMRDGKGMVLAAEVFGWNGGPADDWWRARNHGLASQIVMACRYESEPFWCNADGFHAGRANRSLEEMDLRDFERRSLVRCAIVVPVHQRFNHIGAVSFVPRDPDIRDLSREFAEYGDRLGLYARAFISSYQNIMVVPDRLPVAAQALSKREAECVNWLALGKTDDEIGTIIRRSRATVRFHMRSALAKFDCVSRSQLLFKAVQLGYINIQ